MSEVLSILVAGGGIGGLAFAVAARRAGSLHFLLQGSHFTNSLVQFTFNKHTLL